MFIHILYQPQQNTHSVDLYFLLTEHSVHSGRKILKIIPIKNYTYGLTLNFTWQKRNPLGSLASKYVAFFMIW